MITPPALPSLTGLAWARHKKPGFSTRVAPHVSGREVRVALMSYPLYEFEAVYNGLASSPTAAFAGLGSSSLQNLMGFFLQLLGRAGTFLYADPDDNSVTGQSIGVGDNATQTFLMGRTFGGFNEPVCWVTSVSNVYLNGVAQSSSAWVFTAPNSLGFYTAPGTGVAITADFSYAFQCRFLDDQMDFEEFMSSLWKLGSMKFRSVKANTTLAAAPQWYTPYEIGGAMPTLFADFTTEGGSDHYLYNGTSYASCAVLLTALGITFSRASSAYFTNASGLLMSASSNVPRFDYDASGNAKGLMLEPAATNMLTQSQNYTTTWIAYQGTVTANTTTAPDGTTTADTYTGGSHGNSIYEVYQNATMSPGNNVPFAFSAYVKAGTCSYVALSIANLVPQWLTAVFDLTAGAGAASQMATGASGASILSTKIEQAANGFWRITLVGSVASGSNLYSGIQLAPAATGNTFDSEGDVLNMPQGETIILWGSQFELGNASSSYIPTTTASASRAADSLSAASVTATSAGTLYAKIDTRCASATQRLIQLDDGTANNRASLSLNSSGAGEFDFLDVGTSEAALTAGTMTAGTAAQLAAAYQANDFALVANGGSPSSASSGAIPTLNTLRLGTDTAGGNKFFGHIARIGFWSGVRAPNVTLQSLT